MPPTKERSETTKPFSCYVPSQMLFPLTAADHPSDHRVSGSHACDEYRERLDMSSIDGPRTSHVISRSITSPQTHLQRALVQVMLLAGADHHSHPSQVDETRCRPQVPRVRPTGRLSCIGDLFGRAISSDMDVAVTSVLCCMHRDEPCSLRPFCRCSRRTTAATPAPERFRGSSSMLDLAPLSMGTILEAPGASDRLVLNAM